MLQETVQFYRWQNESLMFKCSIPKVLTNGSHNLSTKRLLGVKPAGKVTCSYMFQLLSWVQPETTIDALYLLIPPRRLLSYQLQRTHTVGLQDWRRVVIDTEPSGNTRNCAIAQTRRECCYCYRRDETGQSPTLSTLPTPWDRIVLHLPWSLISGEVGTSQNLTYCKFRKKYPESTACSFSKGYPSLSWCQPPLDCVE